MKRMSPAAEAMALGEPPAPPSATPPPQPVPSPPEPRRSLSPRPWRTSRGSLRANEKATAGWDRMIKRILGFEQRKKDPAASSGPPSPVGNAMRPGGGGPPRCSSAAAASRTYAPAHGGPAFTAQSPEPEDPMKQMKKLTRDWIVSALNTPNSMRQIVAQFRHIVEGFWPFNNPLLMNVPHPDIMHVIAEEMQTILIKCEAKTVGYPCVAAQPHSMPHFCNYLNLLGHFISEFVNLPFPVPDFLMDIAFRSCVLCLQPPLQWQMAQALVRLWRMVGCEMEARLHDFADLVDGIRDAVLLGERASTAGDDDGPDPKALLIEALELRARGWRPASKSGEGGDGSVASACAVAAGGGASSWGEGGGVTALTEALARATLRVDNFGAAGDCGRSAAAARVGVAM